MGKLIDENGTEYTTTTEILNHQKEFYENLYDDKYNIDGRSIDDILGENINKLSNQAAEKLEGEISYSELLRALKNMKNDKSPGLDGFTVEFFKFFWIDLGNFILRSLNFGYNNGTLSVTQKQGIITCLPKQDKNRVFLKNWRPISLLNVIYKLASSVIANRIKTQLSNVIHEDQKGFIAGRYIGENVRLIYDVLFETKKQNIPGIILSVDFEKAFDTVSWKFIEKVLKYFNFGPSIISWIKLFQNGSESCIIQNGFISDFLRLKRGCRQGDPISPYIFILCAEILGQMLRNNENIKGININNREFLLSQYADDTQVFLDGSEKSLSEALLNLDLFHKMSGLKINVEKTKVIWIGSLSHSDNILCQRYKLDWNQGPFKILGVTFTAEVFDIWDFNSNSVLNKVENIIKQWARRKLTLFGRVTVIKSLALAKFIHLFLALPNPPGDLINTIDKLFFKFLWNGGPDRIKRNLIVKDLSVGGMRMINIRVFIKALKISWIRRVILNSENNSWYALSKIDFQKFLSLGQGYANNIKQDTENPFWKEILQNWFDYCNNVKIETINHILDSPLWYNRNLLNGENLCINNWFKKGIRYVSDILDEHGNFYQFDVLKTIYNIRGTFLDFQTLIRRIPNTWKEILRENRILIVLHRYNVKTNIYVQQLLKDKKGCRRMYDTMLSPKCFIHNNKWEQVGLNINEQTWKKYHSVIISLIEVKIKDFQYKITNKILVTKSFLYRINKTNDNLCEYCHQQPETIFHLFVECEEVKQFWNLLNNWLSAVSNLNMTLNDSSILFSYQDENSLRNYLYVLAKYYIYSNKFSGNGLSLQNFKAILKRKFKAEKYIAYLRNSFTRFMKKWTPLYDVLNQD